MKGYNEEWNESCNLPNYCACSYCQYWDENGSDKERDPVWKDYEDVDLSSSLGLYNME